MSRVEKEKEAPSDLFNDGICGHPISARQAVPTPGAGVVVVCLGCGTIRGGANP